MKNIKMRPPVPIFNLFKKSSMILYLFLKPKSRAKAYIIKTVVWCLRNRKDVKKTVQKKTAGADLECKKKVVTNFCKIDTIYIKVIVLIFVVIVVVIIIIANVAILFLL